MGKKNNSNNNYLRLLPKYSLMSTEKELKKRKLLLQHRKFTKPTTKYTIRVLMTLEGLA